ncbi:hypothetical protein OIU74_015158 [Salix koriyanagi]|uniref:Uncharacterized protein n=1 Tax=Salix koriyanagi TaxID=2511006 RepID=A0A9Q0SZW1_9ROSI|nr:hypothetical protein OIU74_015158 [Salix koriyanagi]
MMVTASMNSRSFSKAFKVSGKTESSMSILPSSNPGNNVTFPSNLFADPLRTATALPQPKSGP